MKKLIRLLGYPLEHSLSPAMQNAAIQKLGIDYEYSLYPVQKKNLAKAVLELRGQNFAGANVTLPYKEKVIKYLDLIDENANQIGAVNTIVNKAGKLIGYNTDCPGFMKSLKLNPKDKKILLLGCGGVARAISVGLCQAGAAEIFLSDIDPKKTAELEADLNKYFKTRISIIKSLRNFFESIELLVNASPVGMHPEIENSPLPADFKLVKRTFVYDLIYNPAETRLIKFAKTRGCQTSNGLEMLARQGALAFELFTGHPAPFKLMLKTLRQVP